MPVPGSKPPQKRIEFTISPDGSTKIEAFGFDGRACLEATKPFEANLGDAGDRQSKPELNRTTLPAAAPQKNTAST